MVFTPPIHTCEKCGQLTDQLELCKCTFNSKLALGTQVYVRFKYPRYLWKTMELYYFFKKKLFDCLKKIKK